MGSPARGTMSRTVMAVALFAAAVEAFAPQPMLRSSSKLAMSKMAPQMSMEVSAVEQLSTTLAGVVAVDGGTIGLDVSFGAFLAHPRPLHPCRLPRHPFHP